MKPVFPVLPVAPIRPAVTLFEVISWQCLNAMLCKERVGSSITSSVLYRQSSTCFAGRPCGAIDSIEAIGAIVSLHSLPFLDIRRLISTAATSTGPVADARDNGFVASADD